MRQQTDDEKTLKNSYKIFHEEIKSAGNIERVLIERTALLNLEI
jgi:KEOPS complex subunit Cgi121